MNYQNIMDRIFPPKYNFYEQLSELALINKKSISALNQWANTNHTVESIEIESYQQEINRVKYRLEKELVEAFSTPFDREILYKLSLKMDRVFDYTYSTYLSIRYFKIEPDEFIINMILNLQTGLNVFYKAILTLKDSPSKTESMIPEMRHFCNLVEHQYIEGMSALFECGDAMHALKFREIYHHIKDASSTLNSAIDTLHKIIVGLA